MKKSIILGVLAISVLGLTACGNSKQKSEVKPNPNEVKLLNEDDTTGASHTERTDNYSLQSNNNGKATYKFKIGKNISFKLNNYKYAKINRLNKNRTNIDMHLDNKNDDHRLVTLNILKNDKKFRTVDLEIENGIQSYIDKQNKMQEEKDKATKKEKQDKLNAEYPDFSSKFPAGVNSSSNEQLSNVQMRFTGKVYGLGADSMGDYMVILKDGNGNLGYISYDHSKTGKITLDQQLTIYGSTNGKGHVRSQDVDDLGVPETDEGKSTVILNADKITKE